MRKKAKRFSVSLSGADYKKLVKIGKKHRPPFTLQYLVNWAIQTLLDRERDPRLYRELGNPIRKEKE